MLSYWRSSTTKICATPTTLNIKKNKITENMNLTSEYKKSITQQVLNNNRSYHTITNIESPDKHHKINLTCLPLNGPVTQYTNFTASARQQPLLPDLAQQITARAWARDTTERCTSDDSWNQWRLIQPCRLSLELSSLGRRIDACVTQKCSLKPPYRTCHSVTMADIKTIRHRSYLTKTDTVSIQHKHICWSLIQNSHPA